MSQDQLRAEAQQAGLLRECRARVATHMRRAMGGVLRELNEALFDRAFGEGGNVADSPYFDAVREIQFRKQEIALLFEKRLTDLFETELRRAREEEDAAPAADSDYSPPLAAECRQALLALDKRIGVLMRDPNLSRSRNPLEPARIFEAFHSACREIDSGDQARRLLLEVFERHMQRELGSLYGEINAVLARRGVLPGLSLPGPALTAELELQAIDTDPTPVPGPVADRVREQLELMLAGRRVPHFIRSFLVDQWSVLLAGILRDKGVDSPEWDKAMQTAASLVQGVQEPGDGDSRRQAIWALPGLVHRLRRGMRAIPMSIHDQMLFLRTLRAYHLRMIGQKAPAQSRYSDFEH